ncbi:hypothetical protein FPZ54_12280 [Sphingomonas suaedae]|uniref:Uncharacterized protein n=1 Tax=Sphingomonas suaedae TaxID=2599297 RepID=A0A518RH07_9SPHN|nr:hypothetical protein [Sphingomonas suaedae]QDX26711.1 hypothetical protein FPZ54_12280 [Sphingomonas suaedae]
MIDLVFRSTREEQLFIGALLLVAGLLVMPMVAGLLLKAVVGLNIAVLGELAGWQVQASKWVGAFFAIVSVVVAVRGAIFLSTAVAATAGLVRAPWQ